MKILSIFLVLLFLTSNTFPQVNTEKFRISTDSLGFSIRSDIDFTIMAGNTDFTFLGTNTRINYNWGDDYTFLVVNGGFGRNKGVNFFSQAILHLRNVNSLNNIIQLEEFAQYDNSKQILLLDRALIGLGLRLKLVDTEEIIFRIGPSLFYEHEVYDVSMISNNNKENLLRASLYFTTLIKLQDNLTFLSTSYFQPAVKDVKDFRFLSDNALNTQLGETVDLVFKLQIRFDNLPLPSIKKFDLVSRLGIAVNI